MREGGKSASLQSFRSSPGTPEMQESRLKPKGGLEIPSRQDAQVMGALVDGLEGQ